MAHELVEAFVDQWPFEVMSWQGEDGLWSAAWKMRGSPSWHAIKEARADRRSAVEAAASAASSHAADPRNQALRERRRQPAGERALEAAAARTRARDELLRLAENARAARGAAKAAESSGDDAERARALAAAAESELEAAAMRAMPRRKRGRPALG